MKLISMTEFVLEISGKPIQGQWDDVDRYHKIVKYANFLKQPLTLGMFVPCDEDGNVLEEPKLVPVKEYIDREPDEDYVPDLEQYQQAKDRVMFEGEWKHSVDDRYTYMNWCRNDKKDITVHMHSCKTIEDMLSKKWYKSLKLTPTALKQIGLKDNG